VTDDPPPRRSVDSSAWTGPQPLPGPPRPPPPVGPPPDAEAERANTVAIRIAATLLAVLLIWSVFLTYTSPTRPSPATGQTEAFSLSRRGAAAYVTPRQQMVGTALLGAACGLPLAYLGWHAIRRRFDRRSRQPRD
jgi:hypothetical protein